jgi:hypothetical protein
MAMGIHCTEHATPSIRKKLAVTSLTCGGRSVGVVLLRTKTTFFLGGGSVFISKHADFHFVVIFLTCVFQFKFCQFVDKGMKVFHLQANVHLH